MTKRFAVVLVSELVVTAALLTVALDVQLHHKFASFGAVNMWGYRGPVMPARKPPELRIAVVGGTFAYGWGVEAEHTLAGYLRQLVSVALNQAGQPPIRVTAANLAGIDIRPADYTERIRRYAYLAPDLVCIEPDPPVENAPLRHGTPERSGVFALTGYMPALPLVLAEKGRVMGTGSLARATAGAGEALDTIDLALKVAAGEPFELNVDYVDALAEAVTAALAVSKFVIVVMPPRRSALDRDALDEDAVELARRLSLEPRVRVVDLRSVPEMDDDALWLNRIALGAGGHAATAYLVAPTVLELVRH